MSVHCITHRGCNDGTLSAAIVKEFFKKKIVEVHYASYDDQPIDHSMFKDKDVYITDFIFDVKTLLSIMSHCKSLKIYDHHEKARSIIIDLLEEMGQETKDLTGSLHFEIEVTYKSTPIEIIYNQLQCGSSITWHKFFPEREAPFIVELINDYDLWKHEMPTNKYNGLLFSGKRKTTKYFQECLSDSEWQHGVPAELLTEVIAQDNLKLDIIKEEAKHCRLIKLHGMPLFMFRTGCGRFLNEVHEAIKINKQCATVSFEYRMKTNTVKLSFRSPRNGINVNELAGKYGGGGHANAAGASITIKQFETDFLVFQDRKEEASDANKSN
jgi:oligoribonuclease NrnB/cAMP/cGMP phosphodiesterase (DHH superfamily)